MIEYAALSHGGSRGNDALGLRSAANTVRWLAWCRIMEAATGKRVQPSDVRMLEREHPKAAKVVQEYVRLWDVCDTDDERQAAMTHLDPICSELASRALRQMENRPRPTGGYNKQQRLERLRAGQRIF